MLRIVIVSALAFSTLLLSAEAAPAKKPENHYSNKFFSLNLPDTGWRCTAEDLKWICRNPRIGDAATIVLQAQERPQGDSLGRYKEELRKPKTIVKQDGSTLTSQVKEVESVVIMRRVWVEAVHFDGEQPGFVTRYYVTLGPSFKYSAAISIAQKSFQKYSGPLEKTAESLKIRDPDVKEKSLTVDPRAPHETVPGLPAKGRDD